MFIVGQDLDAIRGYLDSACCPRPDGLTAYVSFYNLLSEAGGYGGSGPNVLVVLHPDERPSVSVDYTPPTQRELAEEVLAMARRAVKPVMIAEAAPQGFDLANSTRRFISAIWDGEAAKGSVHRSAEEIWNAWYEPLFRFMEDNRDVIRALAYINCNWEAQPMWGPPYDAGYWGDSQLEANAALGERFSHAIGVWKSGLLD